ncbi:MULTISPECIES: hypothetical protein [unclassified Paenibacillus]|uniref:hypothetical protein n=1 Tax=unclassified Paenibacillus TaxID=185978 RepID=UPI0009A67DD8|nr:MULTISPECIES: hypothetical protein [unclassified Paenibacillus]SLJ98215.1 hypothetical protein SAMN06272722_102714 [Paenibacillus sp. RU5A]SOC66801.1 hypothetical protein SAMN05880581_102283 [Paenibacillus sp. RU26A]SOC70050.1 hypothetical protein SAMN05880586_102714 [Paenibacillus sp. RU5M]
MTKQKLTTHYCIDKKCGFEETSHKIRDGWKCPKCNSHMGTRIPDSVLTKQIAAAYRIPPDLLKQEVKLPDGLNPSIVIMDELCEMGLKTAQTSGQIAGAMKELHDSCVKADAD